MSAKAIGYIDPQSVRNMRNGTSKKEFVWPTPDTGLRPVYLNPLLSWAGPDAEPSVAPGGFQLLWVAVRDSMTGLPRTRPAAYLNGVRIEGVSDAVVKGFAGNGSSWKVVSDSTSAWVVTGWHVPVAREREEDGFIPLLASSEELLGWTAMPDWGEDLQLDGVTLLDEIRDRAVAVLSDENVIGHDVAAQILSLVDAPVPAGSGVSDVPSDEAFRRVRAALAFIAVYEPDDHARQSVQYMLGWAAVARRQADKALEMLDSALAEESWQSIEKAPKDGRPLWVYNGEQGVMKWIEGEEYALWVWVDPLLSDADPSPEQPTHFRPLPASPAGS
ncbi:hypothetical protein VPH13_12920 [Stenotrophomonas pavanii]|uniref:hypothetical protein n=1 Tax=Stenotrophomonas pavanii TaxID=487698 RepID=UPI002DBDAAAA|nr:hypothetical protein [Stenotrophomonas pavanii]MEC4339618.1 hypothetical protein [Stenotrophomonas pavanii]